MWIHNWMSLSQIGVHRIALRPNYHILCSGNVDGAKKIPNLSYSKWIKAKKTNETLYISGDRNYKIGSRELSEGPYLLENTYFPSVFHSDRFQYKSRDVYYNSVRFAHSNASGKFKIGHKRKKALSLASLEDAEEFEPIPIQNNESSSEKESNKIDGPVIHEIDYKEFSLIESERISKIFPLPKHTLKNYQQMIGEKCFEEHFKHVTEKFMKKKKNDPKKTSWHVTLKLIRPEKLTFEGDAFTKSAASDKAIMKALHWLYANKKINSEGKPIHSEEAIQAMHSNLNPPLIIDMQSSKIENMERLVAQFTKTIEPLLNSYEQNTAINFNELQKSDSLDEDEFDSEKSTSSNMLDSIMNMSKEFRDPIFGISSEEKDPALLQKRSAYLYNNLSLAPDETELPITHHKSDVIKQIESQNATVIQGAPGCGKSTRVPSYLLNKWIEESAGAYCNIIVSEPRRVAALSLAARVASERGEDVGNVCGYQVRLSSKFPRPPGGAILYCTAGSLLRRLAATPNLPGCTHLILDEAHERSADSDISMALAKKAIKLNPDLKVVVMSATIDTELFSNYFNNCPIVKIPGFTYPVKSYFLDDLPRDLQSRMLNARQASSSEDSRPFVSAFEVVSLIKWINRSKPEGAILVFLPGWSDIKKVKEILEEHSRNELMMVLPIHSRLSNEDQQKIFSAPPRGIRKVVLATNIAETSITINDVSYVIDSGVHKEQQLISDKGISTLNSDWIARSNIKQRKGRAGRVKPGECYHMYTEEKMSTFDENPLPEILRVPLEKTVLDCKIYGGDEPIIDFLQQFPQPPNVEAVETAIKDLVNLGALDKGENLTPLGKRIISFTTHPKLSKALIHSTFFKVVTPVIDMATFLSNNVDIFTCSVENREEVRNIKRKYHPYSDHLAMYWIAQHYQDYIMKNSYGVAESFCRDKFLRRERLDGFKNLREICVGHLQHSKMLPERNYQKGQTFENHDRLSDVDEIIKGVLYSGLNTLVQIKNNVQSVGKLAKVKSLRTDQGQKAFIASDSVNRGIEKKDNSAALLYCGAIHSQERRGMLIRDTSVISPLTIFLFASNIKIQEQNENTTVFRIPGKRIQLQTKPEYAGLLMKYRKMMWSLVKHYVEFEGSYDYNNSLSDIDNYDEEERPDYEVITEFRENLLYNLADLLSVKENECDN